MKFTQANVTTFKTPSGKPDHMEWDEALPGFGIRVQNGGGKSYVAQYKIGTRQRRLSLGKVEKVSLLSAQREAKSIFESVAKKIDPAIERGNAIAEAGKTFSPAIDGFLAKLKEERSESYHTATKKYLEEHFKALHKLPLASIDQATASRELKTIDKERGPIAMNRARSAGSVFFNWAWREGLCKHNPFEMTNKNEEDEDGRERTLEPKELNAIWSALPDDDYGDIVRLLTFTLCRRTEIGSLRRTEINWAERTIELPAKEKVDGRWERRTKNGRVHVVPLTRQAFAILAARKDGEGEFVFGRYDGPYSGWSKSKAELDEKLDIPHWVLHDLRRTGDTVMSEDLSVLPHIVDAVMNHVSTPTSAKKGIRKKYNKAQYLKEKRDALEQYAEYVLSVVS
jgi:integrase